MPADQFDPSSVDYHPGAVRRLVACATLILGAAMTLLVLFTSPSAMADTEDQAATTELEAVGKAGTGPELVGGTAMDQPAAAQAPGAPIEQLTDQLDAAGQATPPAGATGGATSAANGTPTDDAALAGVPLVPFTDPKDTVAAATLQQGGDGTGDEDEGDDEELHTYDHPVEAAYRAEGAAWYGVQQKTSDQDRDAAKAAYTAKVLETDAAILEDQRHLAYKHGDPSDVHGAEQDLREFDDQTAALQAGEVTIDPRGGRTALDASYLLRHTVDAGQAPASAEQHADDQVEELDAQAAGAKQYADTLGQLVGQAVLDSNPAAAQARTVAYESAAAAWQDRNEELNLAIAQRDRLRGFQDPMSDVPLRKVVQDNEWRARQAVEAPPSAVPAPEDLEHAGPAVDDEGHRLDLSEMYLAETGGTGARAGSPRQRDENNQIGALEALEDGQPLTPEQTSQVLQSEWLRALPKSPAEWQARAKGMLGTEQSALSWLRTVQDRLAEASAPGRVQGPFEPSVEQLRETYEWWAKEYRRTWLATDDAMANRALSGAWLSGDPSTVHAAEHDLRELHRRADALPEIELATGSPLPDAPNGLRELDKPWLTTAPADRRPAPTSLDPDATQPRPVLLDIGGGDMTGAEVEVELFEPGDGEWVPFRSATVEAGGRLLLDSNEVKPGQRLRIRLSPGTDGEGEEYGWVATRPDAENPGGLETVISERSEMILTVPELPIAIRDPDIFEYPEAVVIRPIAGEHIQWRVQSQQAPPGSPSSSGSAPSEQQAGAPRLPGATEPLGMRTVRLDRPATGGTSISIGTDAPVDIEVSGAAVPGGRRIIRGGTGESLDLQGLRPGERMTVTLVPREAWQGVDGGWTVTRPDGSVGGETEVVSTEPSFELIVPLPTGASRDASVYENPAAFIYRPVSRDQLSQFPR